MCPRMSSSWPAASQRRSVPLSALRPPLPRPARGLRSEAAAGEPELCRWRWPSGAPVAPGTEGRGEPYLEL